MENYSSNPKGEGNEKDKMLWQVAKKRAAFKSGLATYLLVNLFLIGVWYYSNGQHSYFWPIWPILGWGLGVAIQYFEAYHGSKIFSAEKEYEKLKKKN